MHTLALGLALVALAAPPSFEEQKKTATTVERLASTVASLVGVCPDGLMADEFAECQANIGKAGKSFEGKKVYLYLGGGQEQFLSFGDKSGDRAKQRGLAAARRPDEHADLARAQAQGDIVHGRLGLSGVANAELGDVEEHDCHCR